MHKATGSNHEASSLLAAADSNDDGGSAIVRPPVTSNGSEPRPATPPTVHAPGDPTHSATPTSSPELQPVASTPLRSPERYQILGEHGRGGIGRVSRAHDRELGRDVAIKELISRGRLAEARFLREALITARLEHPGIVPVHEAGRWPDGTPFYAMKLVSGRPLRDLIAERTLVDQRLGLLHHVIAVADAIAYAHRCNIIHRDLKPANVIVGDFGETIVIDWGLAKDLSAADEPTIDGSGTLQGHNRELTAAGAVLGTPTYMAPEQERGEPVDQRSDVFAIGAMLWELCSLHKVPPTNLRQRHRLLRRAGIDKDLVVILDKALNPVPNGRYHDAGALASDLRAFKSGARISARSYSLYATLAHWTRRHLALAVSSIAICSFALIGVVLYISSVTAERDRADSSEESARRARASAETALDDLTLKHAQLLLTSDPSAAIDVLRPYRGADKLRANQIRAEATGLGTSLRSATPHAGMVRWMEPTPDGAIVSLGTDGTIVRTSADGTAVTISRDVARFAQLSYSRTRHLLAYACDPSDLCLYDISSNLRIPAAPFFQGIHVAGLAFSKDGSLLAVMSRDTTLRVFDVKIAAQPKLYLQKTIRGGNDVVFFRNDIVIAGTQNSIEFIHLGGGSETFGVPNNSFWDAQPEENAFAIATVEGQAFLYEGPPMHLVAQTQLCHGPIVGLRFIPRRHDLAFGCREGHVGLWNPKRNVVTSKVRIEGYADLVNVNPTGEYIVAAGGKGIVTLLDLRTDLATSYKGHLARVTAVSSPSSEYPFLLSADMSGVLRVWPLPVRIARVATTLNSQFNSDIFDRNSNTVIATSHFPVLTVFSPATGVRSFGPHEPYNHLLVQSDNRNTFATYGLNELIELWSTTTMTRTNLINTRQGSLTQLSFIGKTDDIITSGRDGRLVRWTPSGEETLIAKLDQPIESFTLLLEHPHAYRSIIFNGLDGSFWHTTTDGEPVRFRQPDVRVSRLITLPDGLTVLAGNVRGEVLAINTSSWKQDIILRASGVIREISVTPDERWIAVATSDGFIHVGAMQDGLSRTREIDWRRLIIPVRHQAMTPDGLLIAVGSDGVVWVYSIPEQRWLCLPIINADFRWVATSMGGDAAAALDVEGRLIWIDMKAARALLDVSNPH